ncbi:MAG: hypothetical protein CMJ32_02775 [Phycisphaerae bacterium]|nr:hypothetical protein [Phycisphaerae bacterium]
MAASLDAILQLEVPLIVQIGRHTMPIGQIKRLQPGSIIELPKDSRDELDILLNDKVIGRGRAVKVSENFGIRLSSVGNLDERVDAFDRNADPGS